MAGIFERLSMIFRSKAHKALDKHEDPRETLDYSYQRQLELLQKVRRGVADVATSRKRVEIQGNQIGQEMDKLTAAAQRALSQGREDLAREALTRKSGLQAQLDDLQTQHAALAEEEEKLVRASWDEASICRNLSLSRTGLRDRRAALSAHRFHCSTVSHQSTRYA